MGLAASLPRLAPTMAEDVCAVFCRVRVDVRLVLGLCSFDQKGNKEGDQRCNASHAISDTRPVRRMPDADVSIYRTPKAFGHDLVPYDCSGKVTTGGVK
jgi:hypothetical protein